MTEEKDLLPLGTAVLIKDDDSAYIIMARVFQKASDDAFVAKYKGVPHPWGESQTYKTMLFSETDIDKVLQVGYETKADAAFNTERREGAVSQPVKKETVSDAGLPKEKPKQKKRTVINKDPFLNLREKGKRK